MKMRFICCTAVVAVLSLVQVASAQFAPAPGPGGQPGLPFPAAGAGLPTPPPGFVPPPPPPILTQGIAPASFNLGAEAASPYGGKGCKGGDCGGCQKSGCGKGGCGKGCGKGKGCRGGTHCHRFSLFGEFLYLRARDADVAYGVEVDSAVAVGTPIQVGRMGVVDPDYQPGFRVGVNYIIDECSSFSVAYTHWESSTQDSVVAGTGNAIQSLVAHPTSLAVNSTGAQGNALYDLAMDIVDLEYREMIAYDCDYSISYLVGTRYVGFEQQFLANTPINGNRQVATEIDFNGVGIRLGLEGERFVRERGFIYSKLHGSLVPGEFDATFDERDQFLASVVDTEWEAGRILSIVDFEVGVGMNSACDNWRFSLGYIFSAWQGMVKTDEWISAVQSNNLDNLRDVMTFDGLTARIEGRF